MGLRMMLWSPAMLPWPVLVFGRTILSVGGRGDVLRSILTVPEMVEKLVCETTPALNQGKHRLHFGWAQFMHLPPQSAGLFIKEH
jgi:hypothetical protein